MGDKSKSSLAFTTYKSLKKIIHLGEHKVPELVPPRGSPVFSLPLIHILKENQRQASLGHTEQRTTQRYAKAIALLNHETGEKTFSVLFKDNQL